MVIPVHGLKPAQSQVGVDLSCGYVGVSQDGLHGPQVGPILDHVRGAAMAQHVRAGGASCIG